MDPITLTVVFKGIATLLIITCGFMVARYGFHLYRDGAGHGRDQAVFEAGPIKVKAQSVGSVVLGTAFLWAWAGVAISPSLAKKGDDWRVSVSTPQSIVVPVSFSGPDQEIEAHPEKLEALFRAALAGHTSKGKGVVKLDGKSAVFDMGSIRALKSPTGKYVVTAAAKTETNTATVTFKPKIENDRITFESTEITASTNKLKQ